MKTRIAPCYRLNTKTLAEKLNEISLSNEIITVIRTSEFTNAGPTESDWADYIILYR